MHDGNLCIVELDSIRFSPLKCNLLKTKVEEVSSSTETFTATNNNTTPSALMLSERGGKVVEPAQSQTYSIGR